MVNGFSVNHGCGGKWQSPHRLPNGWDAHLSPSWFSQWLGFRISGGGTSPFLWHLSLSCCRKIAGTSFIPMSASLVTIHQCLVPAAAKSSWHKPFWSGLFSHPCISSHPYLETEYSQASSSNKLNTCHSFKEYAYVQGNHSVMTSLTAMPYVKHSFFPDPSL